MSKITIECGLGWTAIVANLCVISALFPSKWGFQIHRAWRNAGRMRLHSSTACADADALHARNTLTEMAWNRSAEVCEVCGHEEWFLRLPKFSRTRTLVSAMHVTGKTTGTT
jgi:hypothetical protein